MKVFMILLIALFLSACVGSPFGPSAKYEVRIYDPVTGHLVKEFSATSEREFEEIVTRYGDFHFKAGSVTAKPSPVEQAIAEVLPAIIKRGLTVGPPQ